MTVVPRGCAGGVTVTPVVGATTGAIVGMGPCGCPPIPVGTAVAVGSAAGSAGSAVLAGRLAAAVGSRAPCATCAGGVASGDGATKATLSAGAVVVVASFVLPAKRGAMVPSATQTSRPGMSKSSPRRPRRSAATAPAAIISRRGRGRSRRLGEADLPVFPNERRCCAESLRFIPTILSPRALTRWYPMQAARCFDCVKRIAL